MNRTRRDPGDGNLFRAGAWALCAAMIWAACATDSTGAEKIERPSDWAKAIPGVRGFPNLYQVTPTLYRSAQPSKGGLRYLGEQRPLEPGAPPVRTVLSLRAFNEDEPSGPTPPSLRLERIRFKTWHPEDEDVVKFLRIATTPALQPVLVHCQHGSDRTGTMVALYRIVVQGWSKDAALLEMTQGGYGFHPLWQNLVRYVMALDVAPIEAEVARQGPWPHGK
jgi:tyrosine-protein phosphatase SIW14